VYCIVITFSTIKNKILYSLLLKSVCYMHEAVIYLKLLFHCSLFMSGFKSFNFLVMASAFCCLVLLFNILLSYAIVYIAVPKSKKYVLTFSTLHYKSHISATAGTLFSLRSHCGTVFSLADENIQQNSINQTHTGPDWC
jgi:hypothetical protein